VLGFDLIIWFLYFFDRLLLIFNGLLVIICVRNFLGDAVFVEIDATFAVILVGVVLNGIRSLFNFLVWVELNGSFSLKVGSFFLLVGIRSLEFGFFLLVGI
jgi:hypothetical protein